MLKINYAELFSSSFKLLRKDPIIFTPFLFFFLILNLADFKYKFTAVMPQNSIHSIALLSAIWVVSLLFEGTTMLMIKSLLTNDQVHLKASLIQLLKKFPTLLLNSVVIFLPMLFVISYLTKYNSFQNISLPNIILIIALAIFIAILSLVSQFLPVIVILEDYKFFRPLIEATIFAFKNFLSIIAFLLLVLAITVTLILVSLLFETAPVFVEIITKSFFQGIANTIILVLAVNFYKKIVKESVSK